MLLRSIFQALVPLALVCAFSTSASAKTYADQVDTAKSRPVPQGDWNLHFSPLGLLIGGLNGGVDYRITEDWAVGPEISYYSLSLGDVTVKAMGAAARGIYGFNGAFEDGGYFGAGLGFSSVEASATSLGTTYSASVSAPVYNLGLGYQWFWSSFNIRLGGVISGVLADKIVIKDNSGNEVSSYSTSAGLGILFDFGFVF